MLQNIKQLYGRKLGAADGEFGHVKDFYFDDETWEVRYLVADTGSWLSGRQVLLAAHAFEKNTFSVHASAHSALPVNLTRKQIEDGPSLDSHRPVSRQFEEEYYAYYGWPVYWQAAAILAGAGVPPVAASAVETSHHGHHQRDDLHLRSTKAVTGFKLQGADGPIGSVSDFMLDVKNWTLAEMEIATGHWYKGQTLALSTGHVSRISYEDSTVYTNLTTARISQLANKE
jgi:hypothetical protein